MDRDALITMLNKDLADEHISIIRYLIHAYQVGEATPFGSMLLATAREEMWHMDWLGDELGEMHVEPDMVKGVYPHDPTSNASLLRSYIDWEDNLIRMYAAQAESVDDPELKRVLAQLGYESITHKRRFAQWLEKLGPEGEEPFTFGEEPGFSEKMLKRLQDEMKDQYQLVLQHLRHAFVFEDESCPASSELELTAMRHMKHLSLFAEELSESGQHLDFEHPKLDMSDELDDAIEADLDLTKAARERFIELMRHPDITPHETVMTELDNMVMRNELLSTVLEGLHEEAEAAEHAAEEKPAAPPAAPHPHKFTVGSLIKKED